jgi:SAM-dependent methyltransferase
MKSYCGACGSADVRPFYRVDRVPVHSVINIHSHAEAITFPSGDLELAVCAKCGFVFNWRFDPQNMHYCSQCEETQGFSPTFSKWHRNLARKMVDRYHLHGKSIIEIGCGKGEFLSMLCEIGGNRGVGFDPAYIPERNRSAATERIEFIQDLYSEKYTAYQADFVCCKMTLEHIDEPLAFLQMVRRAIGDKKETTVFFQVPDVRRVLTEIAFWDIYYEHCCYFSLGSLARTMEQAGFEVMDLTSDYDGQYIMVDARPVNGSKPSKLAAQNDLGAVMDEVRFFEKESAKRISEWHYDFARIKREGRRVVLWGSGSKGVSFLSTIGIGGAIEYVVDINPHRQGTYMAGNGQRVVSPEFLVDYQPDTVLVMNDVYLNEIGEDLVRMGLRPELKAVCGKTAVVPEVRRSYA